MMRGQVLATIQEHGAEITLRAHPPVAKLVPHLPLKQSCTCIRFNGVVGVVGVIGAGGPLHCFVQEPLGVCIYLRILGTLNNVKVDLKGLL